MHRISTVCFATGFAPAIRVLVQMHIWTDSRLPIRFFIHASVHWLINLHVQCMSTLPCICVSDDGSVAIRPPFAGSVIAQDI